MSKFLSIALAATAAISGVSGFVAPRKDAPAGWATGYLEDYETYHIRYLALGCQYQHGQAFFDECCHPLLATEDLSSRPAECTPSAAASSSAAAAEATSTESTPADDGSDCDDDETSSSAASSTPAPISSVNNAAALPSSSLWSSSSWTPTTSSTPAPQPTSSWTPSSSSSWTPSSSSTWTPSSSSTWTPTSSSSSAAPSSTGSGSANTGGFATYFYQNGNAGACGSVHSDDDWIAAIDQDRYGNSGAQSDLCGKQVKITNTNNGKSVTVAVVDDCPTCTNSNSIDLSVGAFKQIATEQEGEVPIEWEFV